MTENQKNLGKLERVELRDVWSDEAQDFTPWLAGEDGLDLLGKTLGMKLENAATEVDVGERYRADIVCTNTKDGSLVLIENQLEKTDHKHLGQLLTYAAGYEIAAAEKAVSIIGIWIAQKFTEDHRASLDWLNKITGEKFQFFGLEIELWEIEGSKPAPKFNIIAKPNEWSRGVAKEAKDRILREIQIRQQEFWQSFKDYGEGKKDCNLNFTKPHPQNWYVFTIKNTGTNLVARVDSQKKIIKVRWECLGDQGSYYFEKLERDKEQIETELGFELVWEPPPENKNTWAISISTEGDFEDKEQWPELHDWIIENLEKMDKVFQKRLINIKKSLPKIGDE